MTALILGLIFAIYLQLIMRVGELQGEVTDLRKRLDVLDKPCE